MPTLLPQTSGETAGGHIAIQPTEMMVILYHADMAAARRFYGEVLGLKLREETYAWFVGYWLTPASVLCISSSAEERARFGGDGRGVVRDLVVDDVDAAYESLVAKGVVFEEAPSDKPWGLRTASCRDPAGYVVCLTSYLR